MGASTGSVWLRAIAAILVIACVVLVWIGVSVLVVDLVDPSPRKWILRVAFAVALMGAGTIHIVTLPTNALLRVLAFPVSLTLVLAGLGAMFVPGWLATARARAGLTTFLASEDLRAREARDGFSRTGTTSYPQVTRAGSVASASEWVAWESDRTEGAPLPSGARGVLVDVDADGALSLDGEQGLLGRRGARGPTEVAWVAFVSRQWPIAYSYSDGSSTLAERVDVRIVDIAVDMVVARVSVGAIPRERRARSSTTRTSVSGDALAEAIVAALDADRIVAPSAPTPWDSEGCEIPETFGAEDAEDPLACVDGATAECVLACRQGERAACHVAAFTLEHGSVDRARPFFALACRAGSANACANFAGGLLQLEAGEPDVCARRIFEATCLADEPWSCGMLGGMLARGEGGPEDDVRARSILESACGRHQAFACQTLGVALALGELGEVDEVAALVWLDRACALDGTGCEAARTLRTP